jgi:hypothetical protein
MIVASAPKGLDFGPFGAELAIMTRKPAPLTVHPSPFRNHLYRIQDFRSAKVILNAGDHPA